MIHGLGNYLANLLFGGLVCKPEKPLPEILTMPVIFGNGRDDDTEGLRAYIENRPVIWQGSIVQPGDCELHIRTLRLSVCAIWLVADGKTVGVVGFILPDRPIMTCSVAHGCRRAFYGELVKFNCEVEP